MHRTRNAAYGQPYRGFESLPLRQLVGYCLEYLESDTVAALQVWRDLNEDGVTQAGELFTLADVGIAPSAAMSSAAQRLRQNAMLHSSANTTAVAAEAA